ARMRRSPVPGSLRSASEPGTHACKKAGLEGPAFSWGGSRGGCKKSLATRKGEPFRWLAKTTGRAAMAFKSPHDETRCGLRGRLLGENQLAELGGLQAVQGAVVHDGHRLLALQQGGAIDRRLAACGGGAGAWGA